MTRGVLLVGGFFGGFGSFAAAAYVAFGPAAALSVVGVFLLVISFGASLNTDEDDAPDDRDTNDEWEYDADDVGDGTDTP